MALSDDINALPVSPASGASSHLTDHAVIHDALKSHEARTATIEGNLPKKADLIGGRVDPAQLIGSGASGSGIRIDNTIGTRVFVGDVMVHGDTGWRPVPVAAVDTTSFTFPESPGATIYLSYRRIGARVLLVGRVQVAAAKVGTNRNVLLPGLVDTSKLPGGRMSNLYFPVGICARTASTVGQLSTAATGVRIDVSLPDSGTWASGDSVALSAEWTTAEAWA